MIGNPKTGILTLLDDGAKLQASMDFAKVIYDKWDESPVLVRKNPFTCNEFTVRHYVSEVKYQTVNMWFFSHCQWRLIFKLLSILIGAFCWKKYRGCIGHNSFFERNCFEQSHKFKMDTCQNRQKIRIRRA